MSVKEIKISVIITCYNQENFLLETCESIINQTYNNWEAIIINDGSTDGTEKIALAVCKKDSRFQYFYKNNEGVSSARNYGLKKYSGDFIQFLDGDDKLEHSKFELSINEADKDNDLDVIITNFLRFKSKNGKSKKDHFNLNDYQINYKN
jgi:glycosyltransferase involved in cell wall biosynthesis